MAINFFYDRSETQPETESVQLRQLAQAQKGLVRSWRRQLKGNQTKVDADNEARSAYEKWYLAHCRNVLMTTDDEIAAGLAAPEAKTTRLLQSITNLNEMRREALNRVLTSQTFVRRAGQTILSYVELLGAPYSAFADREENATETEKLNETDIQERWQIFYEATTVTNLDENERMINAAQLLLMEDFYIEETTIDLSRKIAA